MSNTSKRIAELKKFSDQLLRFFITQREPVAQRTFLFCRAACLGLQFPVFPHRLQLSESLTGRTLTFIDNDAARASLAKSLPEKKKKPVSCTTQSAWRKVLTFSNIADGPSRGDFSFIEKLGGRRAQLPVGALELALGL